MKASYQSVRGVVAVSWSTATGAFACNITIPPNMAADVTLPGQAQRPLGSGFHQFVVAL